ncbi:MAG TPA: inverse autotransporter beta domain-containing protein [Rhabdochlamydiaceae bacterium]
MFRFFFCAAALSSFTLAFAKAESFADANYYRTAVRHIEGGGIGYEEGYTTLEAFVAPNPDQRSVAPFFDARAHVFDNGRWAANVGGGLRALKGNRVYGINAYYDYRNTSHLSSNQIGVGLEALGKFDYRINGYLPVGKKASGPYHTAFKAFSGHHMLVSQKHQSAMKGADGEIGYHFGKCKSFDFYTAAGPYYFIGKKAPATWGGKARLAAVFKDVLTLEISDSYDRTFHNKFQGQITLSYAFWAPKSKSCCCRAVNERVLQPVSRQEIIVIDKTKKTTTAIDPATGLPYFFVFVNNTGNSDGSYESPYHSLAQAQDNSSPYDIIYVFPGDGTTNGMDAGISLKANQKFWGSGVRHPLLTTQGTISIPAQSSSSPTITNTDINTDGNAIDLAANNAISGFIITSVFNDAIFGTDPQNLEVSFCTFQNTIRFPIEASFPGDASISITNNQFLNNTNGIFLDLHGTSALSCSNNLFTNQGSISEVPLQISATSNVFVVHIENNLFSNNTTGSIRFGFTTVLDATISIVNNTMKNNSSGSEDSLGSSIVIEPIGTTENCTILLSGNAFSSNERNSLYLDTSGAFTTLEVTASENTMFDIEKSAIVLSTPVDNLTFIATDNLIEGCGDNGIGVIASGITSTGNVTISNNTITDIGSVLNPADGIAVDQDFTTLNLTLLNNQISRCEGTGILSFAPTGIDSLTLNISGNTISNCQNAMAGNAASGISIDNYLSLASTVANNTFSDDLSPSVAIGFFTSGNPNVCLTLTDNTSNTNPSYSFTNPGSGVFNLSPCNVNAVNTGTIIPSGMINSVQSCSSLAPCN